MTVGRQEPGPPVSRSAFDVDYRGTEDPDPQRAQDSREGHGFARGSDRPADQTDHRADRAPEDPQEGSLLPSRASEDGQQAKLAAEVPDARRSHAISSDHRQARTEKVIVIPPGTANPCPVSFYLGSSAVAALFGPPPTPTDPSRAASQMHKGGD